MANDKLFNEDRARQLHLFEGLDLMRKIVPTDIDFFGFRFYLEYNRRLFILGEGKYLNTEIVKPQKNAMEGLCEMCHHAPNHIMWAFIYRHAVHDVNEPVYVKDQYVTDIFDSMNLEWKKPTDDDIIPKFVLVDGKLTVKEFVKQIEKYCIANCKFSI
jgi:hypothetical protein